jgi:hypothetical protein
MKHKATKRLHFCKLYFLILFFFLLLQRHLHKTGGNIIMSDATSPQDKSQTQSASSVGNNLPPQQKEWYANHEGKQLGPFTFVELIDEIKKSRIQLTDLSWKQGMPEWKALKEIPEVRSLFTQDIQLKEVVIQALNSFKTILLYPVSGLSQSYAGLKPEEVLSSAAVFFVAYELLWFLALLLFQSQIPIQLTLSNYIMFLFIVAVPFAALIVSIILVRLVGKGTQSYHADLFIASACMLPLAMVATLASILGPMNAEITAVVVLFGVTFSILTLYSGFERIHSLSERAAALAVPITIIATIYLCKVIMTAFFGHLLSQFSDFPF